LRLLIMSIPFWNRLIFTKEEEKGKMKKLVLVMAMLMISITGSMSMANAAILQASGWNIGDTFFLSKVNPLPETPYDRQNWVGDGWAKIPLAFVNDSSAPIMVSFGPSWWWGLGDNLYFTFDAEGVFEERILLPGEETQLTLVAGGFLQEFGTYELSEAHYGDSWNLHEFGIVAKIDGVYEQVVISEGFDSYVLRTEVASVPEPTAMLLIGAGLLGLLGIRKR